MNGMIIMYNLTCITNYNILYSQLTVCTLSCTLPYKVSIEHTAIMQLWLYKRHWWSCQAWTMHTI